MMEVITTTPPPDLDSSLVPGGATHTRYPLVIRLAGVVIVMMIRFAKMVSKG